MMLPLVSTSAVADPAESISRSRRRPTHRAPYVGLRVTGSVAGCAPRPDAGRYRASQSASSSARHRPGVEPALGRVAARRGEQPPGPLVLDALGDHPQPQRAGQVDDRADDRRVVRVGRPCRARTSGRSSPRRAAAGAGAAATSSRCRSRPATMATPSRSSRVQRGQHPVRVGHQRALGDLQLQLVGGTPYRCSSSSIWSAMSPVCRSRTLTLTAARTGRARRAATWRAGRSPRRAPAGEQAHHRRCARPPGSAPPGRPARGRGCCQRSSASTPTTSPVAMLDLRLVEERDPVVGRAGLAGPGAGRRAGSAVGRVVVGVGRVDGDRSPRSLASYIATSAWRSRVAPSPPWSGCSAMPIDALTSSGSPSSATGRSAPRPGARRAVAAAAGPSTRVASTANSSPPSRTTRSSAPIRRRRAARATSTSSRSPTSCPSASLTCRNRSRSSSSRAIGAGRRCGGATAPNVAALAPRSRQSSACGSAARSARRCGRPALLAGRTGPSVARRAAASSTSGTSSRADVAGGEDQRAEQQQRGGGEHLDGAALRPPACAASARPKRSHTAVEHQQLVETIQARRPPRQHGQPTRRAGSPAGPEPGARPARHTVGRGEAERVLAEVEDRPPRACRSRTDGHDHRRDLDGQRRGEPPAEQRCAKVKADGRQDDRAGRAGRRPTNGRASTTTASTAITQNAVGSAAKDPGDRPAQQRVGDRGRGDDGDVP